EASLGRTAIRAKEGRPQISASTGDALRTPRADPGEPRRGRGSVLPGCDVRPSDPRPGPTSVPAALGDDIAPALRDDVAPIRADDVASVGAHDVMVGARGLEPPASRSRSRSDQALSRRFRVAGVDGVAGVAVDDPSPSTVTQLWKCELVNAGLSPSDV